MYLWMAAIYLWEEHSNEGAAVRGSTAQPSATFYITLKEDYGIPREYLKSHIPGWGALIDCLVA